MDSNLTRPYDKSDVHQWPDVEISFDSLIFKKVKLALINYILSQTGEDRLVLNWGSAPSDLDLHLVYFNNHTVRQCEVYYQSRECPGSYLDVDDTDVDTLITILCRG